VRPTNLGTVAPKSIEPPVAEATPSHKEKPAPSQPTGDVFAEWERFVTNATERAKAAEDKATARRAATQPESAPSVPAGTPDVSQTAGSNPFEPLASDAFAPEQNRTRPARTSDRAADPFTGLKLEQATTAQAHRPGKAALRSSDEPANAALTRPEVPNPEEAEILPAAPAANQTGERAAAAHVPGRARAQWIAQNDDRDFAASAWPEGSDEQASTDERVTIPRGAEDFDLPAEAAPSADPFQANQSQERVPQSPAAPAHPLQDFAVQPEPRPARSAEYQNDHPSRVSKSSYTGSPEPAASSGAQSRMDSISSRRGAGYKGLCPVVLRDKRELAEASGDFRSIYKGKSYYFSSAEAKARFDESPARYAPANGGNDVVMLMRHDKLVEGTLDHAGWYKDRLYLFSSAENLESFTREPSMYAGGE
jgi:YHS domain-containing protein